ncbi:MAG: helix-turn-helix transcriptional regulator [Proteobacteria bacterium]|nr:helix-turn-helix transcriptional regulator [Pseudomonadota bacterium]
MDIQKQRSLCPISLMLELLGDKWSLLILRDAILLDKRRYRDFLASPEGISTNILASRLKQLEGSGMLEKFPDPSDGKASLYVPTERGVKLLPLIVEAMRWGMSEFGESGVPEFALKLLEEGTAHYLEDKFIVLSDEREALSHP